MHMKILIVDDDANSLETVSQYLNDAGYKSFTAVDGFSAIEIVKDHSIDLAILDFNLPDINGIDILKQIHAIQPNVPVVIMSADNSYRLQLDAFEAGACMFLSKPINLESFEYYISKIIDSRTNQVNRRVEIRNRSIFIRWSRWIIKRK